MTHNTTYIALVKGALQGLVPVHSLHLQAGYRAASCKLDDHYVTSLSDSLPKPSHTRCLNSLEPYPLSISRRCEFACHLLCSLCLTSKCNTCLPACHPCSAFLFNVASSMKIQSATIILDGATGRSSYKMGTQTRTR